MTNTEADVTGLTTTRYDRHLTGGRCAKPGPKWVIQRCRLQDAAAHAATGTADWGRLAAELGFADQAHLTRVFSETIGVPPAAYRRQEL